MQIRESTNADQPWLIEQSEAVGGPTVVSQGVLHELAAYPSLVAETNDARVGFATYRIHEQGCELLAIASTSQWQGVGTALLSAVEEIAKRAACAAVYLSTTNDNVDALRFYQRRGYHLKQLNRDAFTTVLQLKGIAAVDPVIGQHQIVIRDELVLERFL